MQDRTTVRRIDDSAGVAVCEDLRTGKTFEIEFARIIGADGAMSAVRRLLTGRNQRVGIAMEAMKPQTDYIARLVQNTKKSLFMYRFFIIRKGKPAKPFASIKLSESMKIV